MSYFLDIIIDTAEKIPISFRVAIDEPTRIMMLKLHPTQTRLIHTIDKKTYPGIETPKPKHDVLDKFNIGG